MRPKPQRNKIRFVRKRNTIRYTSPLNYPLRQRESRRVDGVFNGLEGPLDTRVLHVRQLMSLHSNNFSQMFVNFIAMGRITLSTQKLYHCSMTKQQHRLCRCNIVSSGTEHREGVHDLSRDRLSDSQSPRNKRILKREV